ncbi:glycosyltransferase family 4 protein [Chryseobacterium caseinilyticum]|uniref:Glycosyltransferase family 4 protein n=1 Tax=Chryseobacterium caseinilyticum TaxID=2771428 RepID=A0ABR8ZAQ4_9FLAO|nr:glycosyltransferase family 4 protein [Chryseobacterium caseinilyticum]MBD8082311.1 glycosyltransferase family 4 protein [Chryseobacterium caseinilyticum]
MRILVISQYFWPENFKINDICLGLKERGHHIEVLTAIPNYPTGRFFEGYSFLGTKDEVWNDIKIHRSKIFSRGNGGIRLMINYFSFVFFGSLKAKSIEGKFDCIFVYMPSPITVGIPAMIASKKLKIPYYFWVQDLWPESLTAAGGINNKYILGFFHKITQIIYKNAEKVLVQSQGFKNYIINQKTDPDKIIFYPNSTESFYRPVAPTPEFTDKMPSGFCITFAGNLGEAQSLLTVLKAAIIVKERGFSDIKWVFLGDGRQRHQLEQFVNDNHLGDAVNFLGAHPSADMPGFFAASDVLISSLKKDKIFSLTIPSKIQSYLACGKPVLASLDGEGASIVEKANAGYASSAENAAELAENAIKIYSISESDRKEMGKNALAYYKKEFEREMLLDKLILILEGTV